MVWASDNIQGHKINFYILVQKEGEQQAQISRERNQSLRPRPHDRDREEKIFFPFIARSM